MDTTQLHKIAKQLVTPGKGILAADQSANTMNKQLAAIGVPKDAEMRRQYRQLLFTTPGIEQYVTGVIMYDASIRNHTDDGTPFVDVLISKGIIPIIKVDKSTTPLPGFPGELTTQGLDGLDERLSEYHELGARAAKWRMVVNIAEDIPTLESIKLNCLLLARYARLCQEAGIVPIVEPEVIFAGSHDLARAEEVTTLTLKTLFTILQQYRVDLGGLLLKSSMVLAGSENEQQTAPAMVAEATLRTFAETVPHEVPGIVFLSGGQTPQRATQNLNAIATAEKAAGDLPWELAFSFSRGIEQPVQQAWLGKEANIPAAKEALIAMLKQNTAADKAELR